LLREGKTVDDDIIRGACPMQVAVLFLPGILGCKLRILPESVLSEEQRLSWDAALQARLDHESPWLKKYMELAQAIKKEAASRADAVRLMEQSGVGPVTALAFVLTLGPIGRFPKSKQLVSYLGLNPTESSSGGKQRLGSISKQGNSMMRYLLVEAAHVASRFDPELRRNYQRLQFRRGSAVAKVAIARKLAVRLYWKLRDVSQPSAAGSHAG